MLPKGKIISFDPISGNCTRECDVVLKIRLTPDYNEFRSFQYPSTVNSKSVSDDDKEIDPLESKTLRYDKNKKRYTAEELKLCMPYTLEKNT